MGNFTLDTSLSLSLRALWIVPLKFLQCNKCGSKLMIVSFARANLLYCLAYELVQIVPTQVELPIQSFINTCYVDINKTTNKKKKIYKKNTHWQLDVDWRYANDNYSFVHKLFFSFVHFVHFVCTYWIHFWIDSVVCLFFFLFRRHIRRVSYQLCVWIRVSKMFDEKMNWLNFDPVCNGTKAIQWSEKWSMRAKKK